ncbi:MAG: DegV family protein [Clostridia bacterium]
MKIKVTSDSTCDLSKEYIEKHNISIAPLSVIIDGKALKDTIEIVPTDIFQHVEKTGELPTTSAVNSADYIELFSKYTKDFDAIIHVNIGSGFSCCNQNAVIAANEFNNVFVVDSQNLSTGHGIVVKQIVEMVENGMLVTDIVKEIEDIIPRVETSFVVNQMDYLQKGGRCSAVVALSAKLLKIKPCIEVKNGAMIVAKKYQGSFSHVIKKYVIDRLENRNDIDFSHIFITHTGVDKEIVERASDLVAKYGKFEAVDETIAGCTVSSHCGPATLGILFVKKK